MYSITTTLKQLYTLCYVISYSTSCAALQTCLCSPSLGPGCIFKCECLQHHLRDFPLVCYYFCILKPLFDFKTTKHGSLFSSSPKEHKKKGETTSRGQNVHVTAEKRPISRVWCNWPPSELTVSFSQLHWRIFCTKIHKLSPQPSSLSLYEYLD